MQFLSTVHCVISITFTINIGIATYFVYYNYMYHDEKTSAKYDSFYQII